MNSSSLMPEPDHQTLEKALQAYRKFHPDFHFPEDFPDSAKLKALINSKGREIIITKPKGEYQVYFEDTGEEIQNNFDWKKLIGCGP